MNHRALSGLKAWASFRLLRGPGHCQCVAAATGENITALPSAVLCDRRVVETLRKFQVSVRVCWEIGETAKWEMRKGKEGKRLHLKNSPQRPERYFELKLKDAF